MNTGAVHEVQTDGGFDVAYGTTALLQQAKGRDQADFLDAAAGIFVAAPIAQAHIPIATQRPVIGLVPKAFPIPKYADAPQVGVVHAATGFQGEAVDGAGRATGE